MSETPNERKQRVSLEDRERKQADALEMAPRLKPRAEAKRARRQARNLALSAKGAFK